MIVVCVTARNGRLSVWRWGGDSSLYDSPKRYTIGVRDGRLCDICVIGLGPDHRVFDSCQSDRPVRHNYWC